MPTNMVKGFRVKETQYLAPPKKVVKLRLAHEVCHDEAVDALRMLCRQALRLERHAVAIDGADPDLERELRATLDSIADRVYPRLKATAIMQETGPATLDAMAQMSMAVQAAKAIAAEDRKLLEAERDDTVSNHHRRGTRKQGE